MERSATTGTDASMVVATESAGTRSSSFSVARECGARGSVFWTTWPLGSISDTLAEPLTSPGLPTRMKVSKPSAV